MTTQQILLDVPVDVVLRGSIPPRAKQYAIAKMSALIRLSPLRIQRARVMLTDTRYRAVDEHVHAEVVLVADGRPLRAHIAASSSWEAIDLVQNRLRRKLSQLGKHPARKGGRPRSHRPGYAYRPIGERELVCRKAYSPAMATIEEAAFDLEMMDYDFQLFTDMMSGVDCVIYRAACGYRITRVAPAVLDLSAVDATLDSWTAPRMSIADATSNMDVSELPFVFYADATTGRGCVLYRRHDGHYGVITPAGSR